MCVFSLWGEKIIILMIWVSFYMILYFNTKLQKQSCSQLKATLMVAQKPFIIWLQPTFPVFSQLFFFFGYSGSFFIPKGSRYPLWDAVKCCGYVHFLRRGSIALIKGAPQITGAKKSHPTCSNSNGFWNWTLACSVIFPQKAPAPPNSSWWDSILQVPSSTKSLPSSSQTLPPLFLPQPLIRVGSILW